MVREAMGFVKPAKVAPKQISLKELSAKRAHVEKRQDDLVKRVDETRKKFDSLTKQLDELAVEKGKITSELAQRAQDLKVLDTVGYKAAFAEEMEVEPPEQPPPEFLSEEQKSVWIEKQAEANARKRALQELATQSQNLSKRRCATKTQPPEHIDVEPPDPSQGSSHSTQTGSLAPEYVKSVIDGAGAAAARATEAASRSFREETSQ